MMRRATIFALLLGLSVTGGCECLIGECPCPPPGCEAADACAQRPPCPLATIGCPPAASESMPAGRTASEWAADLKSDDRVTRERAVDALARMGSASLAEVDLLLSDPNPNVRYTALLVLGRLREGAWPAVHDVKYRLSDQDPAVRAEAAYVLGLTGCHAAGAMSELICALSDTSTVVRYRAAVAFQGMGRYGEPGRSALVHACRCDRDPRVREAARCALYKIEQAMCDRPPAASY
jgi:HEAT repeats